MKKIEEELKEIHDLIGDRIDFHEGKYTEYHVYPDIIITKDKPGTYFDIDVAKTLYEDYVIFTKKHNKVFAMLVDSTDNTGASMEAVSYVAKDAEFSKIYTCVAHVNTRANWALFGAINLFFGLKKGLFGIKANPSKFETEYRRAVEWLKSKLELAEKIEKLEEEELKIIRLEFLNSNYYKEYAKNINIDVRTLKRKREEIFHKLGTRYSPNIWEMIAASQKRLFFEVKDDGREISDISRYF